MSTLYVDNLEPNLGSRVMAAGHVINQTRSTSATQGIVNTSSYTSVWSPSYTPVSDSSIVYATFKLNLKTARNGGPDARGKYKIFLGATELAYNAYIGLYDYGGSGLWANLVYTELTQYTNSGTSSLTYDVQIATHGGTEIRLNENGTESQVIFTEIAQ